MCVVCHGCSTVLEEEGWVYTCVQRVSEKSSDSWLEVLPSCRTLTATTALHVHQN